MSLDRNTATAAIAVAVASIKIDQLYEVGLIDEMIKQYDDTLTELAKMLPPRSVSITFNTMLVIGTDARACIKRELQQREALAERAAFDKYQESKERRHGG